MYCQMEKVCKTNIRIQIPNVSKQIYILVTFQTALEKFAIAIKSQAWLLLFVWLSGLFEPREYTVGAGISSTGQIANRTCLLY